MKNKLEKRNVGIDVIKGVCILLVVVAHTITFANIKSPALYEWCGAVMLNSFFLVAGWIYASKFNEKTNCLQELKYKIISLGFPYIFLSILAIIFQFVLGFLLGNPYISETYSGRMLVVRNVYCTVSLLGIGTLWFIPIIIISMCVLIIIAKSLKNCTTRLCVLLVLCITCYVILRASILRIDSTFLEGTVVEKIMYEELEFLKKIINGVMYTCLGYLLYIYYNKHNKEWIRIVLSIGLFFLAIITYIVGNKIYIPFYAVSFVLTIQNLCRINVIKNILKPVAWLGRYSLYIMVIHYIIVYPIVMSGLEKLYSNNGEFTLQQRGIAFIWVMIITVILTYVCIRNVNIQFLFGQGEKFKHIKEKYSRSKKIKECVG